MKNKTKTIWMMGCFLAATSAFAGAQVTEFSCQTDKAFMGRSIHKFKFRVENIDSRDGKIGMAYLNEDAENNDEVVKVVSPSSSSIRTLNDNYGIKRVRDGFEIDGDGDGCEFVKLRLYSNTDFQKGFVRVDGSTGCGAGSGYVTVSCHLKHIND